MDVPLQISTNLANSDLGQVPYTRRIFSYSDRLLMWILLLTLSCKTHRQMGFGTSAYSPKRLTSSHSEGWGLVRLLHREMPEN